MSRATTNDPMAFASAELSPAVESAVAAALDHPSPSRSLSVDVRSISFAAREWDRPSSASDGPAAASGAVRSILLVHGITASSRSWWRIGPALAAAGYRVLAVDGPGHGSTHGWIGGHSFRDTAEQMAGFARATGLAGAGGDAPELAVIGHSWGALVAAALPLVGLTPRRVVLLDPPALTPDEQRALLADPTEQRYGSVAEAAAAIASDDRGWHPEDVAAKAEQLTQFDRERVVHVVLDNTWDAGVGQIAAALAAGVAPETYAVVRGVPAMGGLTPDDVAARLAELVGTERVTTLADAPHTPQRTHPLELTMALLRAIA